MSFWHKIDLTTFHEEFGTKETVWIIMMNNEHLWSVKSEYQAQTIQI